MTLDWDFYYDEWLIDKIPDYIDITIEQRPNGYVVNPPELTCYFGANPIYLYGEGKLLHEAIMSPSGFVVYPDFLQRPGFEFVEEGSFSVSFPEEYDFLGRNVVDQHVGMVNAYTYITSIIENMYGTFDGYVGLQTASTDLRKLNSDDFNTVSKGILDITAYSSYAEMQEDGCGFYCTMGIEDGESRLIDRIHDVEFDTIAPGAIQQTPGLYGQVVYTRYAYCILPMYVKDILEETSFQLFFTTMKDFRPGVVIDIGTTNNYDGINSGFRVEVNPSSVIVYTNDGNLRISEFPYEFDFSFPHKILIDRKGDDISLSVDGTFISSKRHDNMLGILFMPEDVPYLSRDTMLDRNVSTGDIEDLAIFYEKMSDEKIDMYMIEDMPLIDRGGAEETVFNNVPAVLSYDLTYNKPTRIFISNFFGGDIQNIYVVNENNDVEVLSTENGMIAKDERSFYIEDGFKVDGVTTNNLEYGVDFVIGERIPALTKFTSDTHIPLKIYMKFKIPEWWDKKNTYIMRLVLRPVGKMLRYSYEKLKTETITQM